MSKSMSRMMGMSMKKGGAMKKKNAAPKSGRKKVTFTLETAHAQKVALLGDFNNWDSRKHVMKPNGDGAWKKTLMLFPGEYEYKFLVDGRWTDDPNNASRRFNPYGTSNSVIHVG